MQIISQLIISKTPLEYSEIIDILKFDNLPIPKKYPHPDIRVVGEDNQTIKIATIRDLKSWAAKKAFQSEYKLVIIQNADNLNIASQNALLKLIEEPNSSTVVILICKNYKNLLPTIQSRVSKTVHNQASSSRDFSSFDVSDLINGNFETRKQKIEAILKKDKQEQKHILIKLCEHLIQHPNHFKNPQTATENLMQMIKGVERNANSKLIFQNLLLELVTNT